MCVCRNVCPCDASYLNSARHTRTHASKFTHLQHTEDSTKTGKALKTKKPWDGSESGAECITEEETKDKKREGVCDGERERGGVRRMEREREGEGGVTKRERKREREKVQNLFES